MVIDGEIQADFALNPEMLKKNFEVSRKKSEYLNLIWNLQISPINC
jgi:phosphotransacetylase